MQYELTRIEANPEADLLGGRQPGVAFCGIRLDAQAAFERLYGARELGYLR